MHAARFVPLQAWYTYAQLGALWHCSPRSVARWLRELRRRDPDRVFVTYKIRHGLRRELLIGQLTAQTIQDRHVLPPPVLRALHTPVPVALHDTPARHARPRA
jgi:hypothetical protein